MSLVDSLVAFESSLFFSIQSANGCFPSNCSDHGLCTDSNTCECDFPYFDDECSSSYESLYTAYVLNFSVLFSFIALISAIQLARFFYSDGFSIDIQKVQHILFLILGIERLVWLLIDPHYLKKEYISEILENLVYGLGLFIIVLSYMLLVMLWGVTYKNASIGHINSWFLMNIRPIFIVLIVLFGTGELLFRVLWRSFPIGSLSYLVMISLYYSFMTIICALTIVGFLFYGWGLYKNLLQFEKIHDQVNEKLKRITVLTVGVTVLCILCILSVGLTFIIEFMLFKFRNMESFLVEQYVFRMLEICFSLLILYGFRKPANEPPRTPPNESETTPLKSAVT